ncbi:DUF1501 domain-containing protein [Poseidonibacter ostreae]|jgi:uncharacterized protein (DUF1501 family)|uniref:DUF1501 domain-containing protein n=2 Tax=Poseidonibacter ostreae TaxID=2654171 RepID=A0A6L4WRI1_9BACT|nr:DUF1501 domain-containing protein [Poseidonibacter ostreae]KAB7888115.1 DUF1501 domain-containing protein [Poseidonibacter ostreae]KAB7891729.1 DUF1501 domain-containing protein [Poseidonibacter ostreae]
MKRRNFIKLSISTALFILSPVKIMAKSTNKKTLVLIELDGGNDGLNTVIPYKSKKYYDLRPTIALKNDDINIIDENYALNKNLLNLHTLYKEKSVAIINALGYEKPNLSHFKSIQIVETAGNGKSLGKEGWISSHLRKYKLDEKTPANAMLIGKRKKGYLYAPDLTVLQLRNIDNFIKKSSKLKSSRKIGKVNDNLDFLFKQEESILNASKSLEKYTKNISIKTSFSSNDLSKDFKEAAKIIKSPLDIPVIKISQKGYDTHSNQVLRQSELLKNLDLSLGSFIKELKQSDLYNDVLIMTYSEFGRRVKENGSNGTDHGTASVQFVLGGAVKGGVYGDVNLNDLKKNNLKYTHDYKELYNTILSKWFKSKDNSFKAYKTINFL